MFLNSQAKTTRIKAIIADLAIKRPTEAVDPCLKLDEDYIARVESAVSERTLERDNVLYALDNGLVSRNDAALAIILSRLGAV